MKTFTIDLERIDCLDARGGIQLSFEVAGTVLERRGVTDEVHILNMSEAVAHQMQRHLEKHFSRGKRGVSTSSPPDSSCS